MSEKSNLKKWKFAVMVALPIFFWASAFPFIKIILKDLSFINLTIMRFFIVCIALSIILAFKRKKFTRLRKKDIIPIFLLGFFGIIGYHLGLNYGEQYVTPGAASLIVATIPIFVVILAAIFLDEEITVGKIFGILIALSGVVIISLFGSPDISIEIEYLSGALGVLIAAIMGAIYTIGGKKMLTRYSPFSLTVYAMLLGSLGLLPFIIMGDSLFKEVAKMSAISWAALISLGLLSTIVAYSLWYMILAIKEASEISVYLYAIPIISTILSYFLLGDQITIFFIVGGILVILGVKIVNKKKEKDIV